MNRQAIALATALLVTTPAFAADLGWNGGNGGGSLYSPTSAANWSGFYAGVNGGYGWGTLTRKPVGGVETESNSSGWNLGAQAGYNVDMGGFVLGGEADINWTSIGREEDLGAVGTSKVGMDAYGTVRGRAGVVFGQVMPYATLGVAWGRGTASVTSPSDVITSQSKNHLGWTAGVGLEAAATDNITIKAEYLYVDLGTQSYSGLPGGNIDATQRFSVVRAGINYKF
jgi:outer membrane immunogenic protein